MRNIGETIHATGNLRYSHVPLFIESVYNQRFLENLKDTEGNLDIQEVENKSLQLLGYLESFQKLEKTADPKERKKRRQKERAQTNRSEQILSIDNPHDLVDFFVGNSNENKQTQDLTKREQLTQKIRSLFSYPQIREYFLTNLRDEVQRYQAVRPKLNKVARMRFAQEEAQKTKLRIAVEGKTGNSGKLNQVSADEISALTKAQNMAHEAEHQVRMSANEVERGFLKVQQLLQYKNQFEKNGFVLTPSRRELVDKISEHVLAGRKVFLVGSTGTGKTEMAFYAADATSGKYEVISWHEGTTPRDLFGYRELWTDEQGKTVSGTKPGPVTRAIESGATAIHDEYTVGVKRSHLSAKALMNAKPGQSVQIPGFNGEVFEVSSSFAEIYTGNLKDEKTTDREDMDPAILRMLSGLKVSFIPAEEMQDIILSNIIELNGVLKLSVREIELVEKLTKAAELMQMFHDREFSEIESMLDSNGFTAIKQIFGDIQDSRLDKNFLDPGTLFGMFSGLDFARAQGSSLSEHIENRLNEFINDPKTETVPEERELAAKILNITGVTKSLGKKGNEFVLKVNMDIVEDAKSFILPSEFASILNGEQLEEDPFVTTGSQQENVEGTVSIDDAIRVLGADNVIGPADLKDVWGHQIDVPIPPSLTMQDLLKMKEMGHMLVLRYDSDANGKPLTMQNINSKYGTVSPNGGKLLFNTDWYKNETFFTSETSELGWYEVSHEPIADTGGSNYWEQTKVLAQYIKKRFEGQKMPDEYMTAITYIEVLASGTVMEELIQSDWVTAAEQLAGLQINKLFRRSAPQILQDIINQYKKSGDRGSLESLYDWSNTRSSDGNLVSLGFAGASGTDVDGWLPAGSVGSLRVAFSRRL